MSAICFFFVGVVSAFPQGPEPAAQEEKAEQVKEAAAEESPAVPPAPTPPPPPGLPAPPGQPEPLPPPRDLPPVLPPPAPPRVACSPPVIFAINGSGGGTEFSDNLGEAIRECRTRMCVRTFHWGHDDVIEDHSNVQEHFRRACCLAAMVKAQRHTSPGTPIVLMGHSAGTHIVLLAAGMLPPDTVDGILLFAPSVGRTYDVRPALRASRGGINAYYSAEDGALDLVESVLGVTADGQRDVRPAGMVGFCRPPSDGPGTELYGKLRQYAWTPALENVGHFGGHSGWISIRYLRSCIVPMFAVCGSGQDW
jgi:hypothetical protein